MNTPSIRPMSELNITDVTSDLFSPHTLQSWERKVTAVVYSTTARTGTAPLFNLTLGTTIDPADTNTTTPHVFSVSQDVLFLRQIASALDFWVPPFLFFIGIFTNTLVIMVMRSKHFRHMSTSFYMAVSATLDTVSVLVPLPPHYLYVNFPHGAKSLTCSFVARALASMYSLRPICALAPPSEELPRALQTSRIFDPIRHLHVICGICHSSGWITSNLGVFLTVAMTVDRSLAIQFPLKAPTLCTVRRAKIVTVCLLVLELLVEGHVAFTSRVVPKGVKAYLCAIDRYFSKDYQIFHDYYWPNMHNVSLMLSFLTIIISNVIIIRHVKRSEDSKDIGEGAKRTGGSAAGKISSKSRQLSVMLVIDSASVISCTMPLTIYMMLDQSFQSTQIFDNSPYDIAKQNLVFSIAFYLIQVNHCTNFFLYCISGARFREALKDVMSMKPRRKNSNIVSSSQGNPVYPHSEFNVEETAVSS